MRNVLRHLSHCPVRLSISLAGPNPTAINILCVKCALRYRSAFWQGGRLKAQTNGNGMPVGVSSCRWRKQVAVRNVYYFISPTPPTPCDTSIRIHNGVTKMSVRRGVTNLSVRKGVAKLSDHRAQRCVVQIACTFIDLNYALKFTALKILCATPLDALRR